MKAFSLILLSLLSTLTSSTSLRQRDDAYGPSPRLFTVKVSQTYINYPLYINFTNYGLKFTSDGKGYVAPTGANDQLPKLYVDANGDAFTESHTPLYIDTTTGRLSLTTTRFPPSSAITSGFLHLGSNPNGLSVIPLNGYVNPAPAILAWRETYGTWYLCPGEPDGGNTTSAYGVFVKPFYWLGVDAAQCAGEYLAALDT